MVASFWSVALSQKRWIRAAGAAEVWVARLLLDQAAAAAAVEVVRGQHGEQQLVELLVSMLSLPGLVFLALLASRQPSFQKLLLLLLRGRLHWKVSLGRGCSVSHTVSRSQRQQ